MSNLLHILPLGSAWMQWDSDHSGAVARFTQEDCCCNSIIVGQDASGKTSLAFQAAVTLATDHKHVTFIRPKPLSRLPLRVHGMPGPEPAALQLVKFWYPEKIQEVVKWCGHMHTQTLLPDVIIVDDLQALASDAKNSEHGIARTLAVLKDAAIWIKSQKGECRLIVTASHRLTSLDTLARHFLFSVIRLSESSPAEGEGMAGSRLWTLSYARPTHSLTLRYSFTQHCLQIQDLQLTVNTS